MEVHYGNYLFCLFRANPAKQLAKHLTLYHYFNRCLAYLLYFLRHKRSNKYRDLLVLVALVELLTIGIQVRDLQASRTANADSQAVATLLRSVATQKHVATRQLYANSNTVHTGMLITIGRSTKEMYTVTINADNNSYQLSKTTLIVPKAQFITK